MSGAAERNAAMIRARSELAPRVGIVLGSGLGDFTANIADAVTIPYGELEGFPTPSVSGHGGALVVGRIADEAVAVLSGRAHYYEHGRADVDARRRSKRCRRSASAIWC